MKLIQLNDKNSFVEMLEEFRKEYVDENECVYNDERIEKELNEFLNKEVFAFSLVDDNQNKLAYLSVKKGFEMSHIASLCRLLVKDEFRGHGYGKKIMLELEKYLAKQGVRQLILGSRRGIEKFYISCGFSGEGLLQGLTDKTTKEEMQEVLDKYKIKITGYKLNLENQHQFYFDAKEILQNLEFAKEIDENDKMRLIVIFTKEI